jgi:hypothetical protein
MFQVGKASNIFHRGLGVIGLILGAGLAFLLKGLNTCAVINLAKIYVPLINTIGYPTRRGH